MINYNWTVNNLLTIYASNSEPEYVVTALYNVEAIEDSFSASISNSASFSIIKSETGYIPYADLTEDQVIAWIKDQLGINGVESIEASLAGQIESQKNPEPTPEINPLPWITN
jgi:hypothetical protein